MTAQLTLFEDKNILTVNKKVANVASVQQRSPFRYPGGKTWLIPTVQKWLKQESKARVLIEPFAGGGIVSLSAAFENLADEIIMVELDDEVAAVWEVILNGKNEILADKILNFELTHENIKIEFSNENKGLLDIAFCTILKNRVSHGGIIAKGSGLIKNGESGKGISSRWYAKTLRDRILAINYVKSRIKFYKSDAFKVIEKYIDKPETYFFIDPPYTVAGKRLYTHFEIEHERLFELVSQLRGKYMLTYDDTPEIRTWANKYQLQYRTIPMKTTHHLTKNEIIICDNFDWWVE